jgi:hypothetical protein
MKLSRHAPWLYLAALAAVNLFICRDAFTSGACGHFASWHGAWMSLARLAGLDWIRPTWWRYWGGGEPLALSYAPLIPFSIAAVSHLFHCSLELALNLICASVYCAPPLLFYLLSWRLSHRAGYSFVATMVWSLASPIALLMPDAGLHPLSFGDPRRLILLFQWDDLPRVTSLAFFPLAAWGMSRALERPRPLYYAAAGIGIAGMMLPNTVGAVLTALLVVTLPLAMSPHRPLALLKRAALIAVAAYVVISPWLPPSFFITTRSNEARNGEAQWSFPSVLALAITLAATWIVWRIATHKLKSWYARWLLLCGTPVILIAAFMQYLGWHFVPQAWRFKMEAEIAIVWIAVFSLRPAIARVPRAAQIALIAVSLLLAGHQALSFHRVEQALVAPVDVSRSIQFRVAKWVGANLPGQRVMMAATLGTFLDRFITADEFSAEQFTSGPNFEQKIAVYTIYTGTNAGDRDAEYSLLWLKAFGVHAIGVPGPQSPEPWRPFAHPRKFEGVLPVLWIEDDTTIYGIPGSPWTAHVLRPGQLVRHPPIHGLDVDELRAFVAAQDSAPGAAIAWEDANRARLVTSVEVGEVVSTQITYDPGWHATVNGVRRPLRPDGIGLMVVEPACHGNCEIHLEFDGGWEWKLCLAASAITIVLLAYGMFLTGSAKQLATNKTPMNHSWPRCGGAGD